MLARLAHIVARHPWRFIGAWIVLTLVGGFAAGQVGKRWYQSFSIPGYSGYETNQKILQEFGTGIRPPDVVVFHSSGDVTTGAAAAIISRSMLAAAHAVPDVHLGTQVARPRTSSYYTTHNLMYVSKDHHTTFEEIYPPGPATFSTTSGATAILAAAQGTLKFVHPNDITVNVTGHD